MTQDIYGLEAIADKAIGLLDREGRKLSENCLEYALFPVLRERITSLSSQLNRVHGVAESGLTICEYEKILKEVIKHCKEDTKGYSAYDTSDSLIIPKEKITDLRLIVYLTDRLKELKTAGLVEQTEFKRGAIVVIETWPLGRSLYQQPKGEPISKRKVFDEDFYVPCFTPTEKGKTLLTADEQKYPHDHSDHIHLRGDNFLLTNLEVKLLKFEGIPHGEETILCCPEECTVDLKVVRDRINQSIELLGLVAKKSLSEEEEIKTPGNQWTFYSPLDVQDLENRERVARVLNSFFEKGLVLLDTKGTLNEALNGLDQNSPDYRKKVEEILESDLYNRSYRINPIGRKFLEKAAQVGGRD